MEEERTPLNLNLNLVDSAKITLGLEAFPSKTYIWTGNSQGSHFDSGSKNKWVRMVQTVNIATKDVPHCERTMLFGIAPVKGRYIEGEGLAATVVFGVGHPNSYIMTNEISGVGDKNIMHWPTSKVGVHNP